MNEREASEKASSSVRFVPERLGKATVSALLPPSQGRRPITRLHRPFYNLGDVGVTNIVGCRLEVKRMGSCEIKVALF